MDEVADNMYEPSELDWPIYNAPPEYADLNEQAEDMFFRLVNELAEKEGITEALKAENQMLWVRRMNAVRETATEIVNNDLIYA